MGSVCSSGHIRISDADRSVSQANPRSVNVADLAIIATHHHETFPYPTFPLSNFNPPSTCLKKYTNRPATPISKLYDKCFRRSTKMWSKRSWTHVTTISERPLIECWKCDECSVTMHDMMSRPKSVLSRI